MYCVYLNSTVNHCTLLHCTTQHWIVLGYTCLNFCFVFRKAYHLLLWQMYPANPPIYMALGLTTLLYCHIRYCLFWLKINQQINTLISKEGSNFCSIIHHDLNIRITLYNTYHLFMCPFFNNNLSKISSFKRFFYSSLEVYLTNPSFKFIKRFWWPRVW